MPDLLTVLTRQWKLMLIVTLTAAVVAGLFAFLSPRKYLSVATALPVNSLTSDRARLFNSHIEALYSDFGTADELDRMEGTAALDTLFIAASQQMELSLHYGIADAHEGLFKAALRLKKSSAISRSAYGELKVKVWDTDPGMAARLANFLMAKLQELHQHLQNQSNVSALEKINGELERTQQDYLQLTGTPGRKEKDSIPGAGPAQTGILQARRAALSEQLQQLELMKGQYQLAVSANAPVLLVVENARPSLWPDQPRVGATVGVAFLAALLFSFFMALFIESRKRPA